MRKAGGHEVNGLYRAQRNHKLVLTGIAHHTDRFDRQKYCKRLAHLIV